MPGADSDGGTAGTEKGRGDCCGAREHRDFFSFLAISPHTALQNALLPSSLVTRTQSQAEVQVTPSAVALAVARGWPKDENEISRAGFRASAGGHAGEERPRVGLEAGAEMRPSRC